MFRPIKLACSSTLVLALFLSSAGTTIAKTAVLFGATGAVGNEILRALLIGEKDDGGRHRRRFTKVILVGRREFPPKVNDLLPKSPSDLPVVVKIQVPDLGAVDDHLAIAEVDACFVAVGAAFPQRSDLHDWHSVETSMAGSMARLCGKMNATSISAFTAVGAEADPEPFAEEELKPTGTPMGWWPVLVETLRMMGLKEKSIESNSVRIPFVRIFQPSNIVTDEIRYGWFDWAVFKFHYFADPWLPTPYHSVTTRLLATAMVDDAANVLSGRRDAAKGGTERFTYGDFARIAAGNRNEDEDEDDVGAGAGEEKAEL